MRNTIRKKRSISYCCLSVRVGLHEVPLGRVLVEGGSHRCVRPHTSKRVKVFRVLMLVKSILLLLAPSLLYAPMRLMKLSVRKRENRLVVFSSFCAGETLCVVPPFLKGHSLAIKITLNDNIPKVDTRDSPLSFCVGLSTGRGLRFDPRWRHFSVLGPQLEQERGIMISFCSSRSEITHMRPRKVCSNTANSQSTEVEAVVISESRVSRRGSGIQLKARYMFAFLSWAWEFFTHYGVSHTS